MYIVPIHNGVSIATSKVQMPKTGQHNTKQYIGASDEMFALHKMTSWVMVLMYFGLLLALIMQESYNMAQNPCSMDLSTVCQNVSAGHPYGNATSEISVQFHHMLQHPMMPSSMQHIDIIRSWC